MYAKKTSLILFWVGSVLLLPFLGAAQIVQADNTPDLSELSQLPVGQPPVPIPVPDGSYYTYGGPNSLAGKFETNSGEPSWQDWTTPDPPENCYLVQLLEDDDPDRDNFTPQLGFVVYESGLTYPQCNFISPEIRWENLTNLDDDLDHAMLQFETYSQTNNSLSVYYTWNVREFDGTSWSEWKNDNFVYSSTGGKYRSFQADISALIDPDTIQGIQIALVGLDLGTVFGFPPATLVMTFDNVSLIRFDPNATAVPSLAMEGQLFQNEPNPFNPSTKISFELARPGLASLHVFDVAGRRVRILFQDRYLEAGPNDVSWDGRDDAGRTVASGAYTYQLETREVRLAKRMTLIK